jgi:glycosyltransferase involved in cell wall biosynthesis
VHVAIDARLADYSPGGIAQYSLQLSQALAMLEAPERLTLLRSARPKVHAQAVEGMASVRLLTPPHHRLEQVALPVELLRLRPDLLHSTDFIPPLRRHFKSVITVHDLGFLHYPRTLTGSSQRYYSQIGAAVRSADRIIAVSCRTRDDLVRLIHADADKIDIVAEAADPTFEPVDSEAALAAARQRLGVSRPYVLFVGNLEPRKNLLVLLEAFARVRHELDVQLALVGRRGWLYEPVFRRVGELDLEPHLRLVAGMSNAELPPIYSAAALLALPSLYEGFGLPALEAMACGCPVVASDRGSLPEVVADAGLLVHADDPAGLAAAMLRVLTDSALRADLVRRGLRRSRNFSWRKAALDTLAVYRRALV